MDGAEDEAFCWLAGLLVGRGVGRVVKEVEEEEGKRVVLSIVGVERVLVLVLKRVVWRSWILFPLRQDSWLWVWLERETGHPTSAATMSRAELGGA